MVDKDKLRDLNAPMASTVYQSINSSNEMYMSNYKNILAPGREPKMTKEYKPNASFKLDKYLNPATLKRHVLNSEKISQIIEFYARRSSASKKDIAHEIRVILDEIGLDRNLAIIRWCGMLVTALSKRITSGIYVNETSLMRVREGLGKFPVLYLPSHRSYLDFILMSYICFHYDIEIPGIAAGMDFHAMVGIGTMLRKTGAFFMRRSFTGDELYWDVFKEYVYALVSAYHIGVEFFIEGTRSRNFKALVPKVGLLSMALKPFFGGDVTDIKIVPISVSYERVLEEQLFVYELLGVPKPKESTKGFLKALKIIDERFGRMYMDFGEPISIREYFGKSVDRTKQAHLPTHAQQLDRSDIKLVKSLAMDIVYQQQRGMVITTFNLTALYYSYSACKNQTLTLDELSKGVVLLYSIFEKLGAHVTTNLGKTKLEIVETVEIHANILSLVRGKLKLSNSEIETPTIEPKCLKGHAISTEIMRIAVPCISLQLYVNPCMFWLAAPALLLLSAMNLTKDNASTEQYQLKSCVQTLNLIFKDEFIFDLNRLENEFEENLRFLQHQGIFVISNGQIQVRCNEVSELLLCSIAPFLCIYFQLTDVLASKASNTEFTTKEILIETQKHIENLLLKTGSRNVHPYCLALDNLNIALNSFIQNKCLLCSQEKGKLLCHNEDLSKQRILLLDYCELLPFSQLYNNGNFLLSKL